MNRWVTNTCQAISYGPLYEPVLSKISAVILLTYWVDLYDIFNCVMTWKRFSAYCCVGGIHTSYFWFATVLWRKSNIDPPSIIVASTIDHRCIDALPHSMTVGRYLFTQKIKSSNGRLWRCQTGAKSEHPKVVQNSSFKWVVEWLL